MSVSMHIISLVSPGLKSSSACKRVHTQRAISSFSTHAVPPVVLCNWRKTSALHWMKERRVSGAAPLSHIHSAWTARYFLRSAALIANVHQQQQAVRATEDKSSALNFIFTPLRPKQRVEAKKMCKTSSGWAADDFIWKVKLPFPLMYSQIYIYFVYKTFCIISLLCACANANKEPVATGSLWC